METFRRFEAHGNESAWSELRPLVAEQDAELYFEGLSHLARRLAIRDRSGEAGELLSFVAEAGASSAPEVASRAREELGVLSGGGRFGRRMEFLTQRFVREVTSPIALIGMTVAGGAYALGRPALLGRLLASPAANFTRGFGARALSSLGAFAVEASAFTLTTRALQAFDGQAPSTSLGHDLLASSLSLGGLKLFGVAGNAVGQKAGSGAFSRAATPTAAYLGILVGHGLEQAFALRPTMPADQILLDSLVMLLQFQVGGRLAAEAVGPRGTSWQREMQLRGETALEASPFRPPSLENFASPTFAKPSLGWAGAFPKEPRRPGILMMVAKRPGESGPVPVPSAPGSGLRMVGEKMALLYENSPILRKRISEQDLASPESLVRRLNALRAEIQAEQGVQRYALGTLVQALVYGGRIPHERLRALARASVAFDLYQEHPILHGMDSKSLSNPYLLVRALRRLRPQVKKMTGHRYKLTTLTDAMQWHPSFPASQLQSYSMAAGASDFVGSIPRRKLRIAIHQLRELSLEQIFLRLLRLKPFLHGIGEEAVTIGYVLTGLRCYGLNKIRGGAINDSAIQHAYALDMVYGQWQEWGGYYRHLDSIPKNGEGSDALAGWSRPSFARAHLLKGNGEPYSESRLSHIARWGTFLWQHREALKLAEPSPITVAELAPGRGTALRDFLLSQGEVLQERAPADFLRSMLELRERFQERFAEIRAGSQEGEGGISLPAMVTAYYKAHQKKAPASLLNYAHQVDGILRRWQEWAGHFDKISALPRGLSRLDYAGKNLKKENGEGFAKPTLNSIVRWGLWLREHRARLDLFEGKTSLSPAAGEY